MNTTDNLEMTRAGIATGRVPARDARFRSASEHNRVNVARVSCPDEGRVTPEAFIEPASRGGKRTKGLATGLTSYAKSDLISRHTPREIIGLTHTKQTIEVTISRHKKETPIFVDLSRALGGKTDLRDKGVHAGR
jgi:hypothetical protein